jgi:hypothetical protein
MVIDLLYVFLILVTTAQSGRNAFDVPLPQETILNEVRAFD